MCYDKNNLQRCQHCREKNDIGFTPRITKVEVKVNEVFIYAFGDLSPPEKNEKNINKLVRWSHPNIHS